MRQAQIDADAGRNYFFMKRLRFSLVVALALAPAVVTVLVKRQGPERSADEAKSVSPVSDRVAAPDGAVPGVVAPGVSGDGARSGGGGGEASAPGAAASTGVVSAGERAPGAPGRASVPPEAPVPGARASGHWKFVPPPGATSDEWHARIRELRERRSVVALEALVDWVPEGEERARLLAACTSALASLGEEARKAFDDLLHAGQRRDVRLAAMNGFAQAFPEEREAILAALAGDRDRVIREKALAMRAALR